MDFFDVIYHLGSLVFGGGKYFYRWYYGIDDAKREEMLRNRDVIEKNRNFRK